MLEMNGIEVFPDPKNALEIPAVTEIKNIAVKTNLRLLAPISITIWFVVNILKMSSLKLAIKVRITMLIMTLYKVAMKATFFANLSSFFPSAIQLMYLNLLKDRISE